MLLSSGKCEHVEEQLGSRPEFQVIATCIHSLIHSFTHSFIPSLSEYFLSSLCVRHSMMGGVLSSDYPPQRGICNSEKLFPLLVENYNLWESFSLFTISLLTSFSLLKNRKMKVMPFEKWPAVSIVDLEKTGPRCQGSATS